MESDTERSCSPLVPMARCDTLRYSEQLALRLRIDVCHNAVQTGSSGSEHDDEPSSRAASLQPAVGFPGPPRGVGGGHTEGEGSRLHELPEAVKFLEFA